MKKKLILACALMSGLLLSGCQAPSSRAEDRQTEETNRLLDDAQARIGMPRITNFTEKRLANTILELRDQPNLATYTYTVDMNGKAHCLGRSIGYGLPYTTQITNPSKDLWGGNGAANVIPQAEPNGLYSSDSTNATWVLIVGADGRPKPAYIESDITVTLEPLRTAATPC